jgi:DNA polymerase III subunit epsilon
VKLLAIIDTETTCLDPKEGHLLEVGVVRYSVEFGCVVDQWSMLVEGAGRNEAESVNRIPVGLLRFGMPIPHVATALAHHLMPCDAILAHNASFDHGWLEHHLESLPIKPWLDTKDDFEWWHGKPGDSLISLAVAHGVPVTSAHRALTDCMLIAGILTANIGAVDSSEDGHLERILIRAARPRALVQGKQSYSENEKAKAAGFRFDSYTKRWLKRVPTEDVPKLDFPFKWAEVAK